jgi:hypothetical protein
LIYLGSMMSNEAKITEFDGEPESDEKNVAIGGIPPWGMPIPRDMPVPKGKVPVYIRFLKEWTDRPDLQDRQCVIWTLSVSDEKLANKRASGVGESNALAELAKQMIKVVDGNPVDWSKRNKDADIDVFWEQIGPKCRSILVTMYLRLHSLSEVERCHFFEFCVGVEVPENT